MNDYFTRDISYFSKTGVINTEKAIELAKKRAEEKDIDKIIVATSSGKTGLQVVDAFKESNIPIIPVLLNVGSKYSAPEGEWSKNRQIYESKGIRYVQGIQTFSGVERAVKERWNTVGPALLMSDALRIPCEGFKVGIEIAVMAADSGFVKPEEKAITISGTGRGADTVLVVKPAYSSKFFDFAVQEIICKPIVHGIKHEAR